MEYELMARKEEEYRSMANGPVWYAVMIDPEDTDWGYGSESLTEAIKMAPKGYHRLVVIDNGGDPVAIAEYTW